MARPTLKTAAAEIRDSGLIIHTTSSPADVPTDLDELLDKAAQQDVHIIEPSGTRYTVQDVEHYIRGPLTTLPTKRHILVVTKAETLSTAACDKLLKVIEEPLSPTVFILLCAKDTTLPLTLRARANALTQSSSTARKNPKELGTLAQAMGKKKDYTPEVLRSEIDAWRQYIKEGLPLATDDEVLHAERFNAALDDAIERLRTHAPMDVILAGIASTIPASLPSGSDDLQKKRQHYNDKIEQATQASALPSFLELAPSTTTPAATMTTSATAPLPRYSSPPY